MQMRAAAMLLLVTARCVQAQEPAAAAAPAVEDAEEIVVIGQRRRSELRVEMLDAERNVYELFNQFNDDARFEIECQDHAKTGTLLETQFCVPAFKREALALEARDYLEAYRSLLDPHKKDYEPFQMGMSAAALIKAGEAEYQRRMRQVAEEQPEFLRALVRYTQIKAQYEAATSMAGAPEPNE